MESEPKMSRSIVFDDGITGSVVVVRVISKLYPMTAPMNDNENKTAIVHWR